ncbi:MAG: hypothetical protein Q8Q09_11470 [Deltaproteobacteria bacterium]|nr:hypothetical protein [Deltaproteobacteria bacterium]
MYIQGIAGPTLASILSRTGLQTVICLQRIPTAPHVQVLHSIASVDPRASTSAWLSSHLDHSGPAFLAGPAAVTLFESETLRVRGWGALAPIDFDENICREISSMPTATSWPVDLLATVLHDLKNSLGAQSLLLSTIEREVKAAAATDGPNGTAGRPPRASLVTTVALCRSAVQAATDRAMLAQLLSTREALRPMSSEHWIRAGLATLGGDDVLDVQREIAPEARMGPGGDPRLLIIATAALVSIASIAERASESAKSVSVSVTCEGDELVFSLHIPSRNISTSLLWETLAQPSPMGIRSATGLGEALTSEQTFSLESTAQGTHITIRTPAAHGSIQ